MFKFENLSIPLCSLALYEHLFTQDLAV